MANSDGNISNLKPVRSKEEARARGRAGGIASGKSRRRKKALLDLALAIRDKPCPGKPGMTYGEAIVLEMYDLALRGGDKTAVPAFTALVELMGEKVDKHQIDMENAPRLVFTPPAAGATPPEPGTADGR